MNKEKVLKGIVEDILWMAARYANGRRTYAPSVVREAVNKMKEIYPEWEVPIDYAIEPPREEGADGGVSLNSDYLGDIFNPIK